MMYITGDKVNRDLWANIFMNELTFFRVTNTTMVLISSKVVRA